MLFELIRTSSDRCYMHGQIFAEKKFKADTIEFNHEGSLPEGLYYLSIKLEPSSSEKRIYIVNEFKEIKSKFVKNNTQVVHNIEIRNKNSLIEIGLKEANFQIKTRL